MVQTKRSPLIYQAKLSLIGAGLWPELSTKSIFLNSIYFFFSTFMRMSLAAIYILLIVELGRLVIGNYQFDVIITSLSVVVTATKAVVKVIIYLKYDVLRLFDDVAKKEIEIKSKYDNNTYELYLESIRMGKLLGKLLSLSGLVGTVFLYITGAYGNSQLIKYNKTNNASLESHFVYQYWFPANKLDHLTWTYSLQFICSYTGAIYCIATQLALITLLMYPAAELKILQHRLKNYIKDDLKENEMADTIMNLKEIIVDHQHLITFTEHINKNIKTIILLEFILTSFDVSFVAVSLFKVDRDDLGFLLFYFSMIFFNILGLAWTCNEIYIQSEAIAPAAFESRWYLLNKEGKQLTSILIARAHSPLQMTIGSFGPMTTQSFLLVMKAAYSYVSVMRG